MTQVSFEYDLSLHEAARLELSLPLADSETLSGSSDYIQQLITPRLYGAAYSYSFASLPGSLKVPKLEATEIAV